MQIEERPRRRPSINLTPLVDVVFILLVFFMLAFTFMEWRAIDLSTSRAQGAKRGAEAALLVRLYPGRRLDLNGEPVTMSQLLTRIQDRVKSKPHVRILVQPKADLPLQEVVTVLDYLSMAGAANVSLMR